MQIRVSRKYQPTSNLSTSRLWFNTTGTTLNKNVPTFKTFFNTTINNKSSNHYNFFLPVDFDRIEQLHTSSKIFFISTSKIYPKTRLCKVSPKQSAIETTNEHYNSIEFTPLHKSSHTKTTTTRLQTF